MHFALLLTTLSLAADEAPKPTVKMGGDLRPLRL